MESGPRKKKIQAERESFKLANPKAILVLARLNVASPFSEDSSSLPQNRAITPLPAHDPI